METSATRCRNGDRDVGNYYHKDMKFRTRTRMIKMMGSVPMMMAGRTGITILSLTCVLDDCEWWPLSTVTTDTSRNIRQERVIRLNDSNVKCQQNSKKNDAE